MVPAHLLGPSRRGYEPERVSKQAHCIYGIYMHILLGLQSAAARWITSLSPASVREWPWLMQPFAGQLGMIYSSYCAFCPSRSSFQASPAHSQHLGSESPEPLAACLGHMAPLPRPESGKSRCGHLIFTCLQGARARRLCAECRRGTCNRGHLWKEFSKQRLQSGDSGRVYMPGAKCDEGMIDMLQGCSGFTSSSGAIEH